MDNSTRIEISYLHDKIDFLKNILLATILGFLVACYVLECKIISLKQTINNINSNAPAEIIK